MRPRFVSRRLLAAALALFTASCATTERIEAASDVHALLIAIRDNDRAAFDAHIDHVALERQMESRILERSQRRDIDPALQGLVALVARPLSQLAGDVLLRPAVFLAVAEYYGYRPQTPIPSQLEIAGALRPVGDGRVCAAKKKKGPCLLTFADEGGVWRLVSFDGDVAMLRLPK
jgi:hypothetical protein